MLCHKTTLLVRRTHFRIGVDGRLREEMERLERRLLMVLVESKG